MCGTVGIPLQLSALNCLLCILNACLSYELISDVGVIESPPQFKGHTTIGGTRPHDGSLDEVRGREGERVVGLVCKGGVGDTECHVCAERLEGNVNI